MKISTLIIILFALSNICSAQSITYSYDKLGRITGVVYPDSNIISYTYDAMGNRATMVVIDPCAARPNPIITASGSIKMCIGDSVKLTASLGTHYLWSTGDTTRSIYVKKTAAITVSTTGTLNCIKTSDTMFINVYPYPLAKTGGNQTACGGNNLALGATPVIVNSYAWTSSPPGFTSSLANPIIMLVNKTIGYNTTYYLTETTPAGCSKSDSAVITVKPGPLAAVASATSICPGTSVSIGGTAVSGSSYSWSSTLSGFSSTVANPSVSPTITSTYTITESISNGCSNYNSVVITVDSVPSAKVISNSGICIGKSISIGAPAVAGSSYNWACTPSASIPALASNPIVSPTITTTYTLAETNLSGCSKSNSVIITVNSLPAAAVISSSTICSGSPIGIGSTSVTGSTYTWTSSPSGFSSTSSNPSVAPTTNTSYTLTETNSNGCTNSNSVAITVNPVPAANSGSASTICSGSSITIGGTAITGNSYSWSPATGLSSNSTSNPIASPKFTTTFTLTETNSIGCTKSNNVTVKVNPPPAAAVIANAGLCTGSAISIGATPVSGSSYLWTSSPSGFASTASNPTVAPTATTTFTLTETNINSCVNSNSVVITLYPLPVAAISGSSSICTGFDNQFTVTVLNVASGQNWKITYRKSTSSSDSTMNGTGNGTFNLRTSAISNSTDYTLTGISETSASPQCTNTLSSKSTVTVNALPTASLSGATTICSGHDTKLTVSVSNVASGQTWSLTYRKGNSTSDSTITGTGSGTFTLRTSALITTTDYIITGIAETSGSLQCVNSSSSTVTITVNALPTATISVASTICSGFDNNLSISVSNVASGQNWKITYRKGASSTDSTTTGIGSGTFPLRTSTLSATTDYTLTGISETSGSTQCTNTLSSKATVNVNPLPTASISGSAAICPGLDNQFTVTVSNVVSGQKWKITYRKSSSSSDSTMSGTGSGTFTLRTSALSATTDYTLTGITETSGSPQCTSTLSSKATTTVNSLPTANLGGAATICSGSDAKLSVSVSNVASGQNWSLTYRKGSSSIDSTLTGTGSGTFTLRTSLLYSVTDYTLTGIAETSALPQCSNTLSSTFTVNINVLPTATISVANTICSGNDNNLSISVSNVASGQDWKITYRKGTSSIDSTTTGTGSGTFPLRTSSLSAKTDYTLTGISETSGNLQCVNTLSSKATVSVNPLPVAAFGSSITICSGFDASIPVSISNIASGQTWNLTYRKGSSIQDSSMSGTGSGTFVLRTSALNTNTNYTLTSISETSGNPSCSNNLSSKTTIYVNDLPTATIGGSTLICSGSDATLVVNINNVAAGQTWALGYRKSTSAADSIMNGTGSGTFNLRTSIISSTTDYSLTSISETSGSPQCTNTLTSSARVSVKILPVATISGPSTICSGLNTNLTVTIYNVDASQTWSLTYRKGKSTTDSTITGTGGGTINLQTSKLSTTTDYILTGISTTSGSLQCSNLLSAKVTVTVGSIPVPSFSINNAAQCFKVNNFNFTDNSTNSTDSVTNWLWEFGDLGGGSTNKSPTYYYSTAGTYPVKLTVISSYGCSNNISKSVTVYPQPKSIFSISNMSECLTGNVFGLADYSTVSSGYIKSRLWDFGDLATDTSKAPAHSYKRAGIDTIKLTVTSNYGCKSDYSYSTVTVFPEPTSLFLINNLNQCLTRNNFNFTDKSTIPSGNSASWNWDFGDGNLDTSQNSSHSYSTVGKYVITLKTTTNNGCAVISSKTVTINPMPVADFKINSTPQCLNTNNFILTDNSSFPSSTSNSWFWNFGDGKSKNGQNAVHTFSNSGKYSMQLIVTNYYGCNDTAVKTIVVNPNPSVPITGTSSICEGNKAIYYTKHDSDSKYTWLISGGTSLANDDSATFSVNWDFPGTGLLELSKTNTFGCTSYQTKNVTVNPNPIGKISVLPKVCLGSVLQFTDSTIGSIKSSWVFGDQDTSTLRNPSHVYSKLGVYQVGLKVADSNGCFDSVSQKITVNPLPNASWKLNYSGKTTMLRAIDSNYTSKSYDWNFGDGTPNDVTSGHLVKHIYPTNKTYSIDLKVNNQYGCSSEHDSIVSIRVSGIVSNKPDSFELNIFPNPFQYTTTIKYNLSQRAKIKISLLDMAGKEIGLIADANQKPGYYQFDINAEKFKLMPGIYLVKFMMDDQYVSRSIVKF